METWVHRVNPISKLGISVLLFVCLLFLHNPSIMFYVLILLLFNILLFSGQSISRFFLFLVPFLFIFVSTSSSMILFGQGENIWWQFGLIKVSEESFYRGIHIGLRALSFALIGFFFILTTKPTRLFYSLMQSARLPYKIGYSLLSGVRLIPQLFDQFQQMRKAIKVRSGGSRVSAVEQIKLIMIPILAGNIRNAHRLAAAMEAKGFTEGKRTFYYSDDYSKSDVMYFLYCLVCFVIVSILSTYYPIFPIDNVKRL